MKTEVRLQEKETYITPDIEIVGVQIEQNILGDGSAPDMEGEDW